LWKEIRGRDLGDWRGHGIIDRERGNSFDRGEEGVKREYKYITGHACGGRVGWGIGGDKIAKRSRKKEEYKVTNH